MIKVQGRCPNGCGETLFLGEGGYVTCSWVDCPKPEAVHDLLTDGNGIAEFVYAVIYSNYIPAEVDSVWKSEDSAEKRVLELNNNLTFSDSSKWKVEKWRVE